MELLPLVFISIQRQWLLQSLYPPKGTEMREIEDFVQSHIATKWWNQVSVLSSLTWLFVTKLLAK